MFCLEFECLLMSQMSFGMSRFVEKKYLGISLMATSAQMILLFSVGDIRNMYGFLCGNVSNDVFLFLSISWRKVLKKKGCHSRWVYILLASRYII